MEAENEQDAHRERLKRFLESLSPEERMAGLTPEQVLPWLPEEMLCHLTDTYLATLPESVREAIRKRLGR